MTVDRAADLPVLEARDLYCERDDRDLFTGLSFTVGRGELLQLAGPNGAGKTTLLRLLAGLNRDYSGEVLFQGQALLKVYAEYAAQRLYLGHLAAVKKALTPLENLRWLTAAQAPDDDRLWQALEQVSLRGYEETPCMQLSAGQQRRVSLARLCATDVPLWILDEPFTALDKDGVSWLEQQLERQVAAGGTVIITSHHALQSVPGLRQLTLGGSL
ncbi:MAG: heme ABC transporter ATP-binding protein CcmA [Oceanospirillaceae bacterium]|nr:heme ABC transporter ATP-binding protein CcmA [Oceanospirillaceae bacterium]|tara:strand:+ start:27928 stop:28572 length:645 start_codon:yes stop_codon:yes gene_type:complete